MNWTWLDATTPERACAVDYQRAAKNGISGHFWPLFDPETTQANLKAHHAKGYVVGVYMADSWGQFQGKTGAQYAEIVHAEVQKLKWGLSPANPKVQFDIEEHDPVKIAACFERWRVLQPNRDTSWTLEGMQGGWMDPTFVRRILDYKLRLVPQAYDASMNRWAEDQVLRDLTRRGFPENIVSLFYDAAQLAPWWRGFAFTQQRLPG